MTEKREAELEKFLEKDIIEFLDQKSTTKGANTQIKEFEEALKIKDTEKASKILEETIKKFNDAKKDDVYKEIYFNKVIDLVRTAHEHTKKTKEYNKLIEDLHLLDKSQQLKQDDIDRITVFEEREQKEEEEKNKEETKIKEKAKKTENEISELNKKLFVSIRKKDLKNAIILYKELKSKFEEYPSKFVEEKKELYNDLIAFYMRINTLKQEVLKNKKTPKIEKPSFQVKQLKLEEIKTEIEKIKKDIKNKEFKEAKTKIINLKHRISLIPNEYSNIKNKLNNITNILIKKIEFDKRVQQNETQRK